MRRSSRVIGQVLQKLDGEIVGGFVAREAEEVGGLDTEASEGGTELIGYGGAGSFGLYLEGDGLCGCERCQKG